MLRIKGALKPFKVQFFADLYNGTALFIHDRRVSIPGCLYNSVLLLLLVLLISLYGRSTVHEVCFIVFELTMKHRELQSKDKSFGGTDDLSVDGCFVSCGQHDVLVTRAQGKVSRSAGQKKQWWVDLGSPNQALKPLSSRYQVVDFYLLTGFQVAPPCGAQSTSTNIWLALCFAS